ncbi:26595_t:CDS:1, partial [Dentiscutata erythropus]
MSVLIPTNPITNPESKNGHIAFAYYQIFVKMDNADETNALGIVIRILASIVNEILPL